MKLLPVTTWLIRDRPELAVVQTGLTRERLGIAVAPDNPPLRDAVNGALTELRRAGILTELVDRWLSPSGRGEKSASSEGA